MSKQTNTNAIVKAVMAEDLPFKTNKAMKEQLDWQIQYFIDRLTGHDESKENYKMDQHALGSAMISNRNGDVEGAPQYDPDQLLRLERRYEWANDQQHVVQFFLKMFTEAQEQLFPEAKTKAEDTAAAVQRAEKLFG